MSTKAIGATSAKSPLAPLNIERRAVGVDDVRIKIAFCGVCHSDIHTVRDEWGGAQYPLVPGHEIVGHVVEVGSHVKTHHVGDTVGVGCMVDSCRACNPCKHELQQFCDKGATFTYNSPEKQTGKPTYGGYSSEVVVDQKFVLQVSKNLDLAAAAPLLCAGITTYSPLRHWKAGPGKKVAVVGLGGLGHMAVKFAAAMGADVTVLSTSDSKKKDAEKLGAHHFENTKKPETFRDLAKKFDLIINTISAPHDYNAYVSLLAIDGTMVIVGVPPEPTPVAAFPLIGGRRSISGSLIGGIKETQEMLNYCAEKNIVCDIETIQPKEINTAYERMIKGDVHYRFVMDMKGL